jgi:TolB-like protein/DNA-binding winged helix-turn-helix (wHTH) protein/tetratricopeptide (TPR) repeat protein
MLADSTSPLQIGDWLVDPGTDTISQGQETQKLEPRTMRLLILLAHSEGAVVSADRMLAEVWPGVIVSPASVYQAVSRLRRLLRDTDPSPTYIATVPRKGYRLVAAVKPVEPPAPTPEAEAQIRKSRRWPLLAGLGGLLLIAAIALVVVWTQFGKRVPPVADTISIVVLPFLDITADKNDQAFCDGLTEELSNWLAQIPTLRVVARTSAFAYRGKEVDVRSIGRALGTTHVLEGSLRRSGNQLRVTTQLVSAKDGYRIWSATFDRTMEDVVKIQEEVARSVADSLEIRLTERASQRLAAREGGAPQAYQLYLLGRHHQQQLTRESNNRAIELYRQALALDDHFALAYAMLAHAYINQSYLNGFSVKDVAAKAEPLLATGLRLNPNLPDLYTTRGGLRSDQGRYDDALTDLRHAIDLNPNDTQAISEMGYVNITNARPREALASYSAAALLDPLDFNLHARRCIALADMARFDEADSACAHARALAPDASWGYVASSWLESARGRIDEALKWNAMALKSSPDEFELYDDRANLLLTLGLPAQARDTLNRARTAGGNDEAIAVRLAEITFYERGAAAAAALMQAGGFDSSTHADTLLRAARLHMLLGEATLAKKLLEKALAAPDLSRTTLDHPFYVRQGESYGLVMALAQNGSGDRHAAEQQLDTLLASLDRMKQAGMERYGVYTLRADILAMRGDGDGAMVSLGHAAELGWRGATQALHDPALASLQSRGDFKALLERLGEQDQRMGANYSTH